MTSTDIGIPKMTNDCNELFSIFMKIGGEFVSDFERNECTLYPGKISCNNLHKIHDKLLDFEYSHTYYSKHNDLIRINFMRFLRRPKYEYDKARNIHNMRFTIKFEKDGRY